MFDHLSKKYFVFRNKCFVGRIIVAHLEKKKKHVMKNTMKEAKKSFEKYFFSMPDALPWITREEFEKLLSRLHALESKVESLETKQTNVTHHLLSDTDSKVIRDP